MTLAKQNLAFRGHREKGGRGNDSDNEGNFLELAKLLSKYVKVLKHHLEFSNKNETYISPKIQDDFIAALADTILQTIIDCAKESKYFSIILYRTIDISRVDQCSSSLRYVNKDGKVEEHFISFEELIGAGAEDYFNVLLTQKLEELALDITNCWGQAYDGASSMAGRLSELQRRVKEVAGETAIFGHCCAHILNLILCDVAMNSSNEAKLFFGTVEKIYKFMSESLPRLHILRRNIDKQEVSSGVLSLKRHSETRWSSRRKSVDTIISCLPELHKSLKEIIEGKEVSLTPIACADAHGLLHQVESPNFYFQLICWQQVLTASDILSKYLQGSSIDLTTAFNLINGFKSEMLRLRSDENFQKIMNAANESLEACGLKSSEDSFTPTRRFSTYADAVQHLKTQVFYTLHDNLQAENETPDLRILQKFAANSLYWTQKL